MKKESRRKLASVRLLLIILLAITAIATFFPNALQATLSDAIRKYDTTYKKGGGGIAFNKIMTYAEQGDTDAQNLIGRMYLHGLGVSRNVEKALFWFTASADLGNARAQYNLGVTYLNGSLVPQDYGKAFSWISKAAEQDHAEAQYALGQMYFEGLGAPQDHERALYWVIEAAEKGHQVAQRSLGQMYAKGVGTPRDYVRAYMWYKVLNIGLGVRGGELRSVAEKMTDAQIAEAEELVNTWQPSPGIMPY